MTGIRKRVGSALPRKRRGGSLPAGLLAKPTAGVAILIAAYLGVLFGITDVVGGGGRLAVAVALALVVATAFARVVSPRTAVLTAAAVLAAGLVGYYFSLSPRVRAQFTVTSVLLDTLRLLTGVSVLRLVRADTWVLATTPIPTFLAWYLACRTRYTQAVLAAGSLLGFLVLTGNAGVGSTLLGVVGAVLAVGLATLSIPSGVGTQWDSLAVLVALVVVLPATLAVPLGAQGTASGRTAPSLESTVTASVSTESIVSASSDSLEIAGDVQLSPEPRFRVRAPTGSKWQTTAYDRYTGSGWVRTGETESFSGAIEGPPGETVTIEQAVTALAPFRAYPAAWKPVSVRGPTADTARVAAGGGLTPGEAIGENETVRIESRALRVSPDRLREAGTEYPEEIADRYTQLPESTPDRVANLTGRIVDGADNRYDAAVAIEEYLPAVKNYSLQVNRPERNFADTFLFEMRGGYCTYFATTMVTMLRTQGIPARFVTGYTAGERVSEGEWLVRAQNAHAWVQVYFPGQGWVDFDPTPGGGRDAARQRSLNEARGNGTAGGAPLLTEQVTPNGNWSEGNATPTPSTPAVETFDDNPSERIQAVREQAGFPGASESGSTPDSATNGSEPEATPSTTYTDPAGGNEDRNGGGGTTPFPDRGTVGYGLLVLIGVIGLAHGTGTTAAASRTVSLHVQSRRDPETDIERAFDRLRTLLAGRYREPRPRETPRAYLDALEVDDERIGRVVAIHERARYANEATRAQADEAIETVDEVIAEATPIAGRPLRWALRAVRRLRG